MKYLVMICRGHVPTVCRGNPYDRINKDIKPFLLYFLPKGSALNWHTMNRIVKGFHLAFKGMETLRNASARKDRCLNPAKSRLCFGG